MRAFKEDLSSMAENKTWLRKTLFFWQGVGENFGEAKAMKRQDADCIRLSPSSGPAKRRILFRCGASTLGMNFQSPRIPS
jgi:hypothetical protein